MSKKSKWLYHFAVPAMVEQEIEIDPTKDEEGNEIKQFKTIKKETPVKCAIRKPTRSLYEDGELFYSVELSKYIQAGMLTKTLLAKRFANDGGALSDEEQDRYSLLYSELHAKEQAIQRIQLDTDNVKKRAKKLQQLLLEVTSIRQQLVEFESTQSALFDQTAEHKARNKAILWWVLNLSYIKDKENNEGKEGEENFRELFPGETTHQKLEVYDVYEEEEAFQEGGSESHLGLALKKFAYFISFWYSGQAVDKEGFKAAETLLDEVDFFSTAEEVEKKGQKGLEEYAEQEKETRSQLKTLVEKGNEEPEEQESENEESENEESENEESEEEESKEEGPKEEKTEVKELGGQELQELVAAVEEAEEHTVDPKDV